MRWAKCSSHVRTAVEQFSFLTPPVLRADSQIAFSLSPGRYCGGRAVVSPIIWLWFFYCRCYFGVSLVATVSLMQEFCQENILLSLLCVIWFINLAAGFRSVSECDLYILCSFEDNFEWCLCNGGSSLSFMTTFFRFIEEINVLILENSYWITQRCHIENFAYFFSWHCLWKVYDDSHTENQRQMHPTQDRSNLTFRYLSSSFLFVLYFGKLSEILTVLDTLLPAHTNLRCIFALWVLFTKTLLFWIIHFITTLSLVFILINPFWNLDPLLQFWVKVPHNSYNDVIGSKMV